MLLLCLSVRLARGRRAVAVLPARSDGVHGDRALVAGCANAAFLLKCYLPSALNDVQRGGP